MKHVTLIFPHQLFLKHPAVQNDREIFLIEETLFFNQYNFHKQKLVLHRASMQFYKDHLEAHKYKVTYIEAKEAGADVRILIKNLAKQGTEKIFIAEVVDAWLQERIVAACEKGKIGLVQFRTPYFLGSMEEYNAFFDEKNTYFHADFYIWQRKRLHILLEKDGSPLDGKWSLDADNRKKFPKKAVAPKVNFPPENKYILEARNYIAEHYDQNYGSAKPPHFFCCTFADAGQWLQNFLQTRFSQFGIYEDAIVANEHILHHSVLSPLLNMGMLTPRQVVDAALEYAAGNEIPLNSLEGFIRQIIGWREYIRIIYEREGVKQRTKNYWKFYRKIPPFFWTGETGIEPIDQTIRKILKTGYCHHIERLMLLGNFMLLCEFDPDEVYRWFMEMYIDAYDWVMVPNVYGMTQFADGGLMTTKPYISGSNYVKKMSDYSNGDWQHTWDALFWRFMHVHREFFSQNPRLGMLLNTFDKMPADKRKSHLEKAEKFLQSLDEVKTE